MAQMYTVAWWASLLFALPLYTTRLAYHNFIEMREMFTQTITALAGAVDKRDPYTSKHSWRVKEIAGDIGREMRLGEADLEALEWGGLLHDVGKIGVPDNVLLKQERLNREERMLMNAHPVLGAQIIAPVTRLSRELPIIRHHHEWYNGSGYPDRLIGDEIPLLARILHVADAFEAMTAQRPYRMTPLTAEQALGELRKFAGVQFDPRGRCLRQDDLGRRCRGCGAGSGAGPDQAEVAALSGRGDHAREPAADRIPGPHAHLLERATRRRRARPHRRASGRRQARPPRRHPAALGGAHLLCRHPAVRHRDRARWDVAVANDPASAASFVVLAAGCGRTGGSRPSARLHRRGLQRHRMVVNGGSCPFWEPSLEFAGLTTADLNPAINILLTLPVDGSFLVALGPLVDIIPSAADHQQRHLDRRCLLALGPPSSCSRRSSGRRTGRAEGDARRSSAWPGGAAPARPGAPSTAAVRAETGLAGCPGRRTRAAPGPGARPGLPRRRARAARFRGGGERRLGAAVARPRPTPSSSDGPDATRTWPRSTAPSALWAGQLISVLGDRVHQIALAFSSTRPPVGHRRRPDLPTATLPNLILGSDRGTLVDRWDQKAVMVVADLLRAALILLIPVAAVVNLALVYPLVFAVTSVSIFFRPARTAVLPRLVRDEDLLTANSAIWLGETIADVIGYPLAAGFVVALGASLPLAFWFDAMTYVASAMLIGSIAVALLRASPSRPGSGVVDDLLAGWRFLRGETVLLANTSRASPASSRRESCWRSP
jgi:putative nucleotidyltransferase with HDIG domain